VLAVQSDDALFIKHDFFIGFLFERIVGRSHAMQPEKWKKNGKNGKKWKKQQLAKR
jgi:hypothetical protein